MRVCICKLGLDLMSEWMELNYFSFRVNCSFYFKIGACRHGDRCSRLHNKPTFSQVRTRQEELLIKSDIFPCVWYCVTFSFFHDNVAFPLSKDVFVYLICLGCQMWLFCELRSPCIVYIFIGCAIQWHFSFDMTRWLLYLFINKLMFVLSIHLSRPSWFKTSTGIHRTVHRPLTPHAVSIHMLSANTLRFSKVVLRFNSRGEERLQLSTSGEILPVLCPDFVWLNNGYNVEINSPPISMRYYLLFWDWRAQT